MANVAMTVASCTSQRIPYDLSAVQTLKAPVHRQRLAIVPLVDARDPKELGTGDGVFIYKGLRYQGTELEQLPGPSMYAVTEVVGQHLARSHLFSQVVLVRNQGQVADGDLVLSGSVRRLRGYVEAEPPSQESGRPANERKVVAEVFLDGLQIQDQLGQLLYDGATGWSFDDKRTVNGEDDPPTPWAVAAEALLPALALLQGDLAQADLSGRVVVPQVAALTATSSAPSSRRPWASLLDEMPQGWRLTSSSTAATPHGWNGNADCMFAELQARQMRRFSRWQGPYQPSVRLWRCPPHTKQRYDARAEFPATYLGTAGGGHYFVWQLGETNWPHAAEQLSDYFAVSAPKQRHTFAVGQKTEASARPKQQPRGRPSSRKPARSIGDR